jgi:[acyl-carrier-protein] S-malonyltransferase
MSKRYLALFPGQGSQKVGMGKDLVDSSARAQEIFSRARSALGFDLSDICFNGPEDALTATAVAQPALLTMSTICFEEAVARGLTPVAGAGHSLGEYSALVAAGALRFEDAVLLVHQRGRYMQEAVAAGAGKMVAVLGKEVSEIETALKSLGAGVAEIANDNAPGQIVVAGDSEGITEFQKIMAGAKMIELKVSAPFHCRLMKRAEEALRKDLATLSISEPRFPVISNYFAQALSDVEKIRESLALQVCGRVRWVESMRYAIATYTPECAVEIGSGTVLSGLMKRIAPEIERSSIGNSAEVAAFHHP